MDINLTNLDNEYREAGNRLFSEVLVEKALANTRAPYVFVLAKDLEPGDEFILNHCGWAKIIKGWRPLQIPAGTTGTFNTYQTDEFGMYGVVLATWGRPDEYSVFIGGCDDIQMGENAPVLIKNKRE